MREISDQSFGIIPIRYTGGEAEFLLIQHIIGHWGFPKGHPEGSEDAISAAMRECREEVGLDGLTVLSQEPITEKYSYMLTGQDVLVRKQVDYFLADAGPGRVNIQPEEIQNFAWLPFAEAFERIQFAENKETLRQANALLISSK